MLSTWKENLLSLLFPRCCPVCGRIVLPRGNLICPSCFLKLSFVKSPTCKKCGKEIFSSTQEYCFDCGRHKRSFESGVALLNYDERARVSMAKIKYKNKREYLDFYASAITRRYGGRISRMGVDALVPVPVHSSRLRVRGFNQARVLAEKLSPMVGIPVECGLLIRNRKTAPQKNLTPQERFQNLQSAFQARPAPAGIRSVLLVDDIYTTGSTAEACARALKKSGVERVYVLVICIGQGQ